MIVNPAISFPPTINTQHPSYDLQAFMKSSVHLRMALNGYGPQNMGSRNMGVNGYGQRNMGLNGYGPRNML
jgi:hypothetical protein